MQKCTGAFFRFGGDLGRRTFWPRKTGIAFPNLRYEGNRNGSVKNGQLAGFVILSADLTVIDPEDLVTLKVVVTIKEDQVIYSALPLRLADASGNAEAIYGSEYQDDWTAAVFSA